MQTKLENGKEEKIIVRLEKEHSVWLDYFVTNNVRVTDALKQIMYVDLNQYSKMARELFHSIE